MRSVTEMIRPFADAKQQFTNVQDGWSQFLHYLRDRNGADIRGTRKLEEIDIALEYVDDNSENLERVATTIEQLGSMISVVARMWWKPVISS